MAKTVKVTVTMPVEDVERLRALDAAGAIESVSGYVVEPSTIGSTAKPGSSAGGPGSAIPIPRRPLGR